MASSTDRERQLLNHYRIATLHPDSEIEVSHHIHVDQSLILLIEDASTETGTIIHSDRTENAITHRRIADRRPDKTKT